jgi:type II secretion system protein G
MQVTRRTAWAGRRVTAFTLVEVLIVVVILGILAAIVIPQFSDASSEAKVSALAKNLQTIRAQLELYKLQHNGSYPTDATTLKDQMTKKTTVAGSTTGGTLGPYLMSIPKNPYTNTDTISADDTATSGWYYLVSSGVATFKSNDGDSTNEAL